MATILVVEDDQSSRDFLATLLRLSGYRVLEAVDGIEGLAIIRSERPDLVVADILMPRMDGFEFVRQLRVDPAIAATRVVFCTAVYLEGEARRLARQCGSEHLIMKPAEARLVLDVVAAALQDGSPPAAPPPDESFDRAYLAMMANKLLEKIEELEVANRRLAALGHQTDLILNAAGEGICGLDMTGRITFANPTAARLLRCPDGELEGKALPDLTRAAFSPLEGGPGERPVRHRSDQVFWRRDGTSFPVEYTKAPIRDGDAVVGQVLVFQDITERRRADDDIRRLNAALEQRAAELESFSYSVSHDLRAPLRAIIGFAALLVEDCGAALGEENLRRVGIIRLNALKMADLIEGLLTFARLGRAGLKLRALDMDALLRDALADVQQDCSDVPVRVQAHPLPPTHGDRTLLHEVLVNLLSNAVKFSRPKGEAVIEVGGYAAPPETVYHVRDHGVGFDMRYAGKLFGVFQRLHGEGEFEGTGIGLALVRRIVQQHGGRVWAEGKENEGATFYFSLPDDETFSRGALPAGRE